MRHDFLGADIEMFHLVENRIEHDELIILELVQDALGEHLERGMVRRWRNRFVAHRVDHSEIIFTLSGVGRRLF